MNSKPFMSTIWTCLERVDRVSSVAGINKIYNELKTFCKIESLDDEYFNAETLENKKGAVKRVIFRNWYDHKTDIVCATMTDGVGVVSGDAPGLT